MKIVVDTVGIMEEDAIFIDPVQDTDRLTITVGKREAGYSVQGAIVKLHKGATATIEPLMDNGLNEIVVNPVDLGTGYILKNNIVGDLFELTIIKTGTDGEAEMKEYGEDENTFEVSGMTFTSDPVELVDGHPQVFALNEA